MVQVVRSASSRTSRISSISKFNTKSFFPTHHSTTTKKSHAHHLCVAPTEIAICTGAGEKSRENNRGVKSVLSFLSRFVKYNMQHYCSKVYIEKSGNQLSLVRLPSARATAQGIVILTQCQNAHSSPLIAGN